MNALTEQPGLRAYETIPLYCLSPLERQYQEERVGQVLGPYCHVLADRQVFYDHVRGSVEAALIEMNNGIAPPRLGFHAYYEQALPLVDGTPGGHLLLFGASEREWAALSQPIFTRAVNAGLGRLGVSHRLGETVRY
jgi:hypothetical protein